MKDTIIALFQQAIDYLRSFASGDLFGKLKDLLAGLFGSLGKQAA